MTSRKARRKSKAKSQSHGDKQTPHTDASAKPEPWIKKNLVGLIALACTIFNFAQAKTQPCREARVLLEDALAMIGGNAVAVDILMYSKTRLEDAGEKARLARSKCTDAAAESYWLEGHILAAEGRRALALERFERAIQIDSNDERFSIGKAIVLGKLRRTNEAIEILRNIIKVSPDNGSALCALATILRDTRSFEEAIEYYDRSIRAGFEFARVRKAELFIRKGEKNKALEELSNLDTGIPLPQWATREPTGQYIIDTRMMSPGSGGIPQPASINEHQR